MPQPADERAQDLGRLALGSSSGRASGPWLRERRFRRLWTSWGVFGLTGSRRRSFLFGYANPVLAMGEEAFARRAKGAGADGVLLTDVPPEEAGSFAKLLRKEGLDLVSLVAPTSPDERLRMAGALSRGFLYLVSRTGDTGARPELDAGLSELIHRVKAHAPRPPLAVGFGISTAEQAGAVARLADGVVVGSALVAAMEDALREGLDPVAAAAARVRAFFWTSRWI